MGGREPDWPSCNLRRTGGSGARGLFQLQPNAPRFEPRRSASALERSPQLAGNHYGSAEVFRSTGVSISTRRIRYLSYSFRFGFQEPLTSSSESVTPLIKNDLTGQEFGGRPEGLVITHFFRSQYSSTPIISTSPVD